MRPRRGGAEWRRGRGTWPPGALGLGRLYLMLQQDATVAARAGPCRSWRPRAATSFSERLWRTGFLAYTGYVRLRCSTPWSGLPITFSARPRSSSACCRPATPNRAPISRHSASVVSGAGFAPSPSSPKRLVKRSARRGRDLLASLRLSASTARTVSVVELRRARTRASSHHVVDRRRELGGGNDGREGSGAKLAKPDVLAAARVDELCWSPAHRSGPFQPGTWLAGISHSSFATVFSFQLFFPWSTRYRMDAELVICLTPTQPTTPEAWMNRSTVESTSVATMTGVVLTV